jgi:transposase
MANRPAPALVLRDGDRAELERLTRASAGAAGLAQRARIVLLAAQGVSNTAIAERVGVSRPTVISWRDRYEARGITGLRDEDRSGRPRTVDRARVIAVTLAPPPKKYGVTHWSSRLLASHLKISEYTVRQVWREHEVRPWRTKSFRFSTDPELQAKVVSVSSRLCKQRPRCAVRRGRGVARGT